MIFARRSIQRFIDQLCLVLPREPLAALVRRLNLNDQGSLDIEWEVAVLYALQRVGEITYEASHGGRTHPDVTFHFAGGKEIAFVADVATVSDRGLEDDNPTELLSELLHKKAAAMGLSGGFQCHIAGAALGNRYSDRKMKLAMPTRKQLPAFVENFLTPWLKKIKRSGATPFRHDSYGITITYHEGATTSGGGHLSYTVAYSLTRNPIFTSLKSKAHMLRDSGFRGCRGIILCDGNCDLLKSRMTGAENYSDQQIISSFLRRNSSVSFVVTLWVEPEGNIFDRPIKRRLRVKLFRSPWARSPLSEESAEVLNQIPRLLPVPVEDALNASHRIGEGSYGIGKSHFGGSKVSIGRNSASIRISARALLELLAGRHDPKDFAERHDFAGPQARGRHNPFDTALSNGLTLESATVEREADGDDDWITLKLSGPDPAISPFRIT